ncbi:MAG: DUF1667 domain-containing protein [Lachnospiraceae bacterium]|nr:DUF1667 domain-containing protein [Lachnospiraceae bacterium]
MEKRELTCIGCPMGCLVTVEMENGEILNVTGNTCKIGDTYARKEVTNPTRIVTSTVMIEGSDFTRLPVKTASDIPKSSIFAVMEVINHAHAKAPVKIGDVVIKDVAGTGVDVVATRNIA